MLLPILLVWAAVAATEAVHLAGERRRNVYTNPLPPTRRRLQVLGVLLWPAVDAYHLARWATRRTD